MNKIKNLFMVLFFIFLSLNAKSQGFTLNATGVPFEFLNINRTTVTGTLGNVGSAVLYTNIATIDGRLINGKITVVSLTNASIVTFDNDTGGTDSNRFQPIYSTTTGAGGFITYKLEFLDKATGVPVYLSNFFFNGIDLDSAGNNQPNNTEVFRLPTSDFASYTVNNPTQLVVTTVGGDTQFRGNANNLGGITFENTSSFYARYISPRSSMTFKIGANSAMTERQTAVNLGVAGVFTNPATFTNTPALNDLQVTKTVNIPVAPVNTVVTFTITAKNNGPGAATLVNVYDKIPSGFTIGTVSAPNGTTYDASSGVWTIGGLANNASRVLTIPATVKATGIYKNEVGISGNETESNAANNNASATVDYCTAPIISSQPATLQDICRNVTATALSVTATGTGTLTYQWYKNTTNSITGAVPISLATATSYTPPTTTVGTTYYYVIITGSTICGATRSSFSRVNVNALTTITAQPEPSQTVCQNATPAAVTMSATGTGILTYNLYGSTTNTNSGGTFLGSSTSPSFVPETDIAGIFYYYVVITSDCAPVTSNVFNVTVNPSTIITAQPNENQNVVQNNAANTLSVTASGTGTLTYQWYSNTANSNTGGNTILNATTSNYAPSTATLGTIYYYAIVTGSCGTATTSTSAVNVNVNINAIADNFTATGAQAIAGFSNLGNVLANDIYNLGNAGSATTSNSTITITTAAEPVYSGAPIPTLNATTGVVSIPAGTPAGTYSIVYTICAKASPSTCDTDTTKIIVSAPAINAVTESLSVTSNGGTTTSVLANDTYNGGAAGSASTTNVNLTALGTWPTGITLNTNGTITVAQGTAPSNYSVQYQICDKLNPTNCASATSIVVVSPTINAVPDNFTATGSQAVAGTDNIGNVLTNDTLNGGLAGSATTLNTSLSVLTAATSINAGPVPTLNATTGVVSIPAGTPAGTYSIVYTICAKTSPSTCDTDTTTIVVSAPSIASSDDIFTSNSNGGTTASVLVNDAYNSLVGGTANSTNVVLTRQGTNWSGFVLNTDGTISVAIGTLPGSYALGYKICDKLNAGNCASSTAKIVVEPTINAIADTYDTTGNEALEGVEYLGNVLLNDNINSGTSDLTNNTEVQIEVITAAVPISGGSVPTLNTQTGVVSIPQGTPAGSYSITYKITDTATGKISSATITIFISAATNCYSAGITDSNAGTTLDTSVGITSLERAGVASAWPQIRKSGWIVLEAKTKGFVINRMTFNVGNKPVNGLGVEVISNPIEGMMVFDTTNNCLRVYTSTDQGITFGWFCMGTQTCPQ